LKIYHLATLVRIIVYYLHEAFVFAALPHVTSASSKFYDFGSTKFQWRLDLPAAVIQNYSKANIRAESPEFFIDSNHMMTVGGLRPILNFAPSSKLSPPPRGEVVPQG
jgi:hypothetical protein